MLRSALFAAVLTVSSTAAATPAEKVLEHWAEVDSSARSGAMIGYGVLGGLATATGGVMLLTNRDRDPARRELGVGLLMVGPALGLGALIGTALAPRGQHEKLLESLRRGVPLATLEREWAEQADAARAMRHGFAVGAFALGVIGFGAGAYAMSRDDSPSRGTITAVCLTLGAVETLLGTVLLATPSTLESSFHTYQKAVASVRPAFAVDRYGGTIGLGWAL